MLKITRGNFPLGSRIVHRHKIRRKHKFLPLTRPITKIFHAFNVDDLPLFQHNAAKHRSERFEGYGIAREITCQYLQEKEAYTAQVEEYRKNGFAWTLTPERQKYFSDFICQKVGEGLCTREELKSRQTVCRSAGSVMC